uniref:Uncharacterized protein n=1 Tax=Anopheles atroparvus TaxID=41427 RepID=A0A182JKK9_ANOAO
MSISATTMVMVIPKMVQLPLMVKVCIEVNSAASVVVTGAVGKQSSVSSSSASSSPSAQNGTAPGSHIPPRYQPPPHPPGGILKNGYTNGHLKTYPRPDIGVQNGLQNGGLTFSNGTKGYPADNLKRPPNPSRLLAPRQHIRFANLPPLVNGGGGGGGGGGSNNTAALSHQSQSQQAAIAAHQQHQQQIQSHHLPVPHTRLSSESSSEDQTTSSTRSLQAHLAHAKSSQGPSAGHIHQTTAIVHHSSNHQPTGSSGNPSNGNVASLQHPSVHGLAKPAQPSHLPTATSTTTTTTTGAPAAHPVHTLQHPPQSQQSAQQQQQQQQQQQEMLKFVRKAESETSSTPTSSSGGGGGGGGRISALEQNRHFQVSECAQVQAFGRKVRCTVRLFDKPDGIRSTS